MPGFIYVMSNPSFVRGRIKIGKSDRDPDQYRKEELQTTGVPEPFRVEYYALVKDHHGLEIQLHRKFADKRVASSREFFDVPVHAVVTEIKNSVHILWENNNFSDPQTRTTLLHAKEKRQTLESSLDDYKKFYVFDATTRRFSIVRNGTTFASTTLPPYLNADQDGIFFEPGLNVRVRLPCFSEISDLVQIRYAPSTGTNKARRAIEWDKLPNCRIESRAIEVERKWLFGLTKRRNESIEIKTFRGQEVPAKWALWICRGIFEAIPAPKPPDIQRYYFNIQSAISAE